MSTATQSAVAEIESQVAMMAEIDQRAVDRVAKLIEALSRAHGDAVKIAVMMLAVRYAHEAD